VAKAVTAGLATGFFVISGLGNGFASAKETEIGVACERRNKI
jgi:hypothetical protein